MAQSRPRARLPGGHAVGQPARDRGGPRHAATDRRRRRVLRARSRRCGARLERGSRGRARAGRRCQRRARRLDVDPVLQRDAGAGLAERLASATARRTRGSSTRCSPRASRSPRRSSRPTSSRPRTPPRHMTPPSPPHTWLSPRHVPDAPLGGWRILPTRPRGRVSELAGALAGLGAEVLHAPLLEITPSDDLQFPGNVGPLGDFAWVVCTSVPGPRPSCVRRSASNRLSGSETVGVCRRRGDGGPLGAGRMAGGGRAVSSSCRGWSRRCATPGSAREPGCCSSRGRWRATSC